MKKNERRRTMVYSNVNKKAEKNSASNNIINLDNEIVIGLARFPEPEKEKKKGNGNNKKKSTNKVNNKKNIQSQANSKKDKIIKEKFEYNNQNNVAIKPTIKMQKRKAIKKMVACLFLLIILIGAFTYFLLSPIFNVRSIEVLNNSHIVKEQIIGTTGIKLNENTFKFSKKQVKNNILTNPYIESVKVHRNLFSGNVVIDIKERSATLMLEYGNSYVYINNQGYILDISTTKLNTVILKGYVTPLEDIKPGGRLNKDDLARLETVLEIIKIAESNELKDLISKIDIQDNKNYIVYFESEGKVAYLGNCSDLITQMLQIKEILKRNEGIDGEIFVDVNLKYPVFRQKV